MKKPARASTVSAVSVAERARPTGMCLGRVVSVGDDVKVELPSLPGTEAASGPGQPRVSVRLATVMSREEIAEAAAAGQLAVLLVEAGAPVPLLLGMVELPAPEAVSVPRRSRLLSRAAPAPLEPQPPSVAVEADVDGRRVKVEAQDELVFRCGKASVTLRRNGRVVIRGTYVETDSEGTNRIKGAHVRLN